MSVLPITIRNISCNHLKAKDATGSSDPYVTFHLKQLKRKSRVKTSSRSNDLNPSWEETFVLKCQKPAKDTLVVNVYDKDVFRDDTIADKIKIPVKELPVEEEKQFEFQLAKNGEHTGVLRFTVFAGGEPPADDDDKKEIAFDIHCVKASDLIKMDGNASDPYIKVYLKNFGRDYFVRTKTVKNNCNPEWNQHIFLTTTEADDTLVVELWDDDIAHDDQMMDALEFPLSQITQDTPVHFDQDVQRKGEPAGHLEFHINPIDPDVANKGGDLGKCHFSWGSYSSSYSTSFSGYSECSKSLSDILKDGDFDHVHANLSTKTKEECIKPKKVHEITGTLVGFENLVTLDDDNTDVFATVQLIGRSALGKGKGQKVTTDDEHSNSPQYNKEFVLPKGKKGDAVNVVVYQRHSQQGVLRIGTARLPIKNVEEDKENGPESYDLKKPIHFNDEKALEGRHESYGKVTLVLNRKVRTVEPKSAEETPAEEAPKKTSSSSSSDEE